MLKQTLITAAILVLASSCKRAQSSGQHSHSPEDTAFAAMQGRGKVAMGVDQYTSAHRFDDLPDGGRIELQRDSTDRAGVATIRRHLQSIATAFSSGNFSSPGFVHSAEVPGTAVMRRKRAEISYRFQPLPGGGEVRITSHDSAAVSAIHDFLAYQRHEHRAPGNAEQS